MQNMAKNEDTIHPTTDQGIADLMGENHASKPAVASEEQQQKFKEKMQDIEIREKERIARDRANELGIGYIDLKGFPIAPETLSLISEEQARKCRTVAFLHSGNELRLGTIDPENPDVVALLHELVEREHVNGALYYISEHSLEHALKNYARLPKHMQQIGGVAISAADLQKHQAKIGNFRDIADSVSRVSLSDVMTVIIAGAVQSRASDIHIEAEQDDVKVRYRIDGVLHDVASMPHDQWPKIISRIKLLAHLKINISDVPQDGRFTITLPKEEIDVRVSSVPTAYGESVVMRLLMSSSARLTYDDLGIQGEAHLLLERELKRPNGMILATGPTGCGKTTTLYALLNKLNSPETKIITLENPVEYKIKGINQSQVDTSRGYNFAKGLRSILRQDPDVVMVGEVRDPETAEIAIQAALTGHLLLSTMHTNSAAGTIPRLLSMQVKPFLLAPALNVIIGQRLVRKICEHCKVEKKIDKEQSSRVQEVIASMPEHAKKEAESKPLKFYEGKGCRICSEIGYRGRIGVFEVFVVDEDVEKMILAGQISEHELQGLAVKKGMLTMVQDGILKAIAGVTTVQEVFKVTE